MSCPCLLRREKLTFLAGKSEVEGALNIQLVDGAVGVWTVYNKTLDQ